MARKNDLPLIPIKDWEHFSCALSGLIEVDALVAQADARRDAAIARLTTTYEEKYCLNERRLRIAQLRKSLEVFADAHRDDFGEGKTRKLDTGSVQWREGAPACKQLTRAWTWAKILAAVVEACAGILRTVGINVGKPDAISTAAGVVYIEEHCPRDLDPELVMRLAGRAQLIRLKAEIDKEAALALYRDGCLSDEDLAALGLRIAPDESFIIRRLDGSLVE